MRIPNADSAAHPALTPKMRMARERGFDPFADDELAIRIHHSEPHAPADRASAGSEKARLLA